MFFGFSRAWAGYYEWSSAVARQKGIVSEVLRRLIADVKEEMLHTAEEGLKETAETLKETAENLYQAGQKALGKRK